MKHEVWRPIIAQANLDLAPPNRSCQMITRERLVCRLLGRGPCCQMNRRLDSSERVPRLAVGENARDQSVAARVEHLAHPVDLDDVDADAEDHRCSSPPERRRP